MATTIPTKLKKQQVVSAATPVRFDTDTLTCLLVTTGGGAPDVTSGAAGIQFISETISANPEVTGTGYTRQTLTATAVTFDSTNTQVDFTFGNITFAQNAAGFTNARYAIIADTTVGGGDSTHPVLAVCDLGSNQSVQSGSLVLTCPASGLIQWS